MIVRNALVQKMCVNVFELNTYANDIRRKFYVFSPIFYLFFVLQATRLNLKEKNVRHAMFIFTPFTCFFAFNRRWYVLVLIYPTMISAPIYSILMHFLYGEWVKVKLHWIRGDRWWKNANRLDCSWFIFYFGKLIAVSFNQINVESNVWCHICHGLK